jgi:hypothetical protein
MEYISKSNIQVIRGGVSKEKKDIPFQGWNRNLEYAIHVCTSIHWHVQHKAEYKLEKMQRHALGKGCDKRLWLDAQIRAQKGGSRSQLAKLGIVDGA